MNLSEAFKMAVQKYYEGYDYGESKKIGMNGKDFEYDFDKLDEIHSELRKPKKRPYVRKTQKADYMDDIEPEDNTESEGFGVNSGDDDFEDAF